MSAAVSPEGRPIFFIGMPRGGTTITFAAFATHRDLAWFSQYQDRLPWMPGLPLLTRAVDWLPSARKAVRRHGESRSRRSRLQITFSEAYGVWQRCCGERFVYDYMLGVDATEADAARVRRRMRSTMRLMGKHRFAAKLTGPGRVHYLNSICPDAIFIHVIRDPRAVVGSLLRVPFWRETDRYREPAWTGGLSPEEEAVWRDHGTAAALAAVQWGAVLRTTREEARELPDGRYRELRYEDFIADPHSTVDALHEFAGLARDPGAHAFIDERLAIRDLGDDWRQRLSADQVETVDAVLAGRLKDLGYR